MLASNLQGNKEYSYDKWLVTDIIGTISNGTMLIDGVFKFVEHSEIGRSWITNGYQHISKVELAQSLRIAKPLTNGIAIVNVLSMATAVTNDFVDGRYKSGSARAVVWGAAAGATFIPVIGWGVSISIGVADAIWGDAFYNYIEKNW